MSNPKLIRVGGHLYQRRDPKWKHPKLIRVGGKIYRLSKTGTESGEALPAKPQTDRQ
jgi:hypothetical protein